MGWQGLADFCGPICIVVDSTGHSAHVDRAVDLGLGPACDKYAGGGGYRKLQRENSDTSPDPCDQDILAGSDARFCE